MAGLTLGPLLRYVDATQATVWVETDAPCTVEVRCHGGPVGTGHTFTVHGHHYALVALRGLRPGGSHPYTVYAGGEPVWPDPAGGFPPSRIRTPEPDRPMWLVFGSCRGTAPHDRAHHRSHGVDTLRAYAHRLATTGAEDPPSLLLLLGDQVYADEPPDELLEFIARRRDPAQPPGREVTDFAEYAELYRLAWSEPGVRWLLSTVPTAMIFDDHELRDDWNISADWQQEIRTLPWWRRRAASGLASYWLYQHLGNLSPSELDDDPLLAAVRAADGDAGELLDRLVWPAGTEPGRYRWSYARDYGRVRVIVLDTRCARVLTPGRRAMLEPGEWSWFDERAAGDVDHLVVASSLPVLLPDGVHELERWNEAVCDGAWGRRAARAAEKVRQAIDLGHWAAFRASFDAFATLLHEIASGARGRPPATLLLLSGDVHYSYLARARLPRAGSAVHQVVCSPIRNRLSPVMRTLNRVAAFGVAGLVGGYLARAAGVPASPLRWTIRWGPCYDNALGSLHLAGREATLRLDGARLVDGDPPVLRPLTEGRLD